MRFSSYLCSLVCSVTGNMNLGVGGCTVILHLLVCVCFGHYGDGDEEDDHDIQMRSSSRRGGGTWGAKKGKQTKAGMGEP